MPSRFTRKWHHVRWSCGDRHIGLSVRFDRRGELPPGATPALQVLPAAAGPAGAFDAGRAVADVLTAVEEFNRRNRTAIRVAAIRCRADDTTGHLEAMRKLLNRL